MPCEASDHVPEYLPVQAIARAWVDNGGDSQYVVKMTAIAYTESNGGDRYAKSIACALGLWQIWYPHAAEYGVTQEQLYDVRVNAAIAIALSGNGDNVAAWDTAYAAGESLVRLGYLHDPQPGSLAYQTMGFVRSALLQTGGSGQTFAPIASVPVPPVVTLPPDVASTFVAPFPAYVAPVALPAAAQLRSDGFDNVRAWYNDDVPYLLEYDNYILEHLIRSQ